MSAAGPPQGANGTAASRCAMPNSTSVHRPPSPRADALCEPRLRPARVTGSGGSAAANAASVGGP